jgi:hypothetical protein
MNTIRQQIHNNAVALIRDLMMLMPAPGPSAGESLYGTWLDRFADLDQLDNDRRHTSAATRAESELSEVIKQTRMAVLGILNELD